MPAPFSSAPKVRRRASEGKDQALAASFAAARHRIAQHIATAPDGFDVIVAAGRFGQLLAELADEDVDDLQFRLVHAAVKMVQEHLLRQRRAFAQRQEFQHLIFLAGQMHGLAFDIDGLCVKVHRNPPGLDHRLAVSL